MTFKKTIFRKEAADGVVVKEVQFDQVRTYNVIDGKACYTKTNDIKRLGFASVDEYTERLLELGFKIAE